MYEFQCVPQGWQCPICKRVYSPSTPMCMFCGGTSVVESSNATGRIGDKEIPFVPLKTTLTEKECT